MPLIIALLLTTFQGEAELSKQLKEARSAAEIQSAAGKLVALNSAPAAKALSKALSSIRPADEEAYWIVIKALASFTAPEPLAEVAKLVRKSGNLSNDIMFMIVGNESVAVGAVLAAAIERGSDSARELAVNHALTVRSPDTVDPLIDQLERAAKRRKKQIESRIHRVLVLLTGVDFGSNAASWRGWWNETRQQGLPGPGAKRKQEGGGTVVESLDPKREDEFNRLKGPIVVIKGECKSGGHGLDHNYDHIEETLTKMKIPHTVITKEQFEQSSFSTKGKMAILINCHYWKMHCRCPDCYQAGRQGRRTGPRSATCPTNCRHDNDFYKMSDMGIAKLKGFVQRGGYLFTEDWQLEEILERAFRGFVEHGDYLPGQVASIYAKPGNASHPYLRRIFTKPPKIEPGGTVSESKFESIRHEWQIDPDSPSIVVRNSATKVLLTSPQLERNNKGNGAVAITFNYANGQVMHVLSHFGKQKKEEDEHALQNLMLNFILEASERWNLARAPKR